MKRLSSSQHLVLQQLVFTESFDAVRQDTGLSFGELRDDLMNLLSDGMVEVYERAEDTKPMTIRYFDADRPHLFHYRATKAGLDAMKQFRP